ncbi:MAG: domain S-box protein, partial [Solirubrobacterales bacterium]|nr:domain S-box protein [Solirubrobacterales bacterium]
RMVYANQAAADLLGAASVPELLAAPPGTIVARFHVAEPDGEPFDVDTLPHRRALSGDPGPPLLTRSVRRKTGDTLWLRTAATLLEDGPLVVSVIQDVTASTEAEQHHRVLAQAGDTLAAAIGSPDAVGAVARLAVPTVADGCAVDLVREDGTLELGPVHHLDPARAVALERVRERHPPGAGASDATLTGAPSEVLRSGQVGVLNAITDELLLLGAQDEEHLGELRALALCSVLTVPLALHGRTLGLMTLANDVSGRVFSPGDVALAQDLGHRVALAVDSARMAAESARTRAELEETLRRLQVLADAGFGGLIRGLEDRIIEANATFLAMVGYASAEDLPPWPRMTPPEWAAVDADAVAQMRRTGTADVFEKEYLRRDGTRVRVLIGATVVDPERFEWMGVVVDVSDRLGIDAVRRAGVDQAGEVVGGLAAAVLIQRPGKGIVYANQAAAEAMGMSSPQAVIAATPEEIAEGWDTFDEHGVPLVAARYPSRRILLGEREVEPLTVRAIDRRSGREYWRVIRARAVLDADGGLAMVVSMTEDITEMRRAILTQRLLAEAGEVLSSSLDLAQTLPRLVALAVPELADWCSIVMPDEHGAIRQVAVAHVDPHKVRFAREYDARWAEQVNDQGGAAAILRGGPATLLASITDAFIDERIADPEQRETLRALGMRSVVQVPVAPAGGKPLAVLSLVNAESERVFTAADLALGEELGRRAGTAIQNARLHAERSHIAATLQASLLPDELPEIDGFRLSSAYRPAGAENWVGGDFYDVFPVADGFMAIVGDVAGHGAEAAALTAQARHTLRAIGEASGDPVEAVGHLNRLLVPRTEPALCTVCAVRVRVRGDAAEAAVTCAGHPLPMLVRDGRVEPVGAFGPLLGAWESSFSTTDVALREGDVLVIYTDGVLERRAGRDRFGEARLREVLAGADGAHDAVARVQAALDAFGDEEPSDDTAVLAIQRSGPR